MKGTGAAERVREWAFLASLPISGTRTWLQAEWVVGMSSAVSRQSCEKCILSG